MLFSTPCRMLKVLSVQNAANLPGPHDRSMTRPCKVSRFLARSPGIHRSFCRDLNFVASNGAKRTNAPEDLAQQLLATRDGIALNWRGALPTGDPCSSRCRQPYRRARFSARRPGMA